LNTPVFISNTIELTRKQREILALTAKGMPDKQIAVEQRKTVSAVKQLKQTVFERLGADNAAHAVAIGKDRGLI
jgi:DNA-binding CsgD family transcriptional regulator